MEKITFPVAIAAICLVFTVKILSVPLPLPPPHPLCLSQFALANQACSLLPIQPSISTNDKPGIFTKSANDDDDDSQDDDLGEDDGDEEDDDGDQDDNDDEHQHEHGHDSGHDSGHSSGHGDRSTSGHGGSTTGGHRSGSGGHGGGSVDRSGGHRHSEGEHGHRGRRSSRHSHHHISQETAECCKWLEEVDASCVCDLLIRLPNFLRRPPHSITVKVQNSCNVTYACQGRLFS